MSNKKGGLNLMQNQGFTLIELLLVIGIIATLAVVVFVALDPAKRFADARDARRIADVETVLSAVHQYIIDNKGALPSGLDYNEKQIGTFTGDCSIQARNCNTSSTDCANLGEALSKYLKDIPMDPSNGSVDTTGYVVSLSNNNIITIKACSAEGENDISVSR
jgi:prepilin-type N-terminal cleavage/methylation domain-containing protein